jgi:hypothetical protein
MLQVMLFTLEEMALATDNTITIYIRLLNEGTLVFRPVQAVQVAENIYKILATTDYDPDIEEWEFPPESVVACRLEKRDGKHILIADKYYSQ